MRPTNSVYVGGPALSEPDDDPAEAWCRRCNHNNPVAEWKENEGFCPNCDAKFQDLED